MTGPQQQKSESDPERWVAPPSSPVLARSNSTGHDDENTARKRKRQHHQHRLSHLRATTEENHRISSSEKVQFLGAYAHIRRKLDYNYHVHYTKLRQWLHDSIIDDCLQSDDNRWGNQSFLPCEPMLILTVGVQGAGKHHTIGNLIKSGRMPLLSSVLVDTGELSVR